MIERLAALAEPWLTAEQSRAAYDRLRQKLGEPKPLAAFAPGDVPSAASRKQATPAVLDACGARVEAGAPLEGALLAWSEWTLRWLELRTRAGTNVRNDLELERHAVAFLLALWTKTGDLRYLNCIYKLSDVLVRAKRDDATLLALLAIASSAAAPVARTASQSLGASEEVRRAAVEPRDSVVILSPSVRSRYTIAVLRGALEEELRVEAVVVRRMLQWRRIAAEWRSARGKLITKVFRRALHVENRDTSREPSLASLLAEAGWPHDVRKACARAGVPLVHCNDFDDRSVLELLERTRPGAVLFTGGGMIRRPVLERAGAGIVNCHMGPLPWYRGMDVVEWPVLHGEPVALTSHFMDEGLDTGPILLETNVPLREDDTFAVVRVRAERLMAESLREIARRLRGGTLAPRPQRLDEGRQFFTMHPRLLAHARERLREVARKSRS